MREQSDIYESTIYDLEDRLEVAEQLIQTLTLSECNSDAHQLLINQYIKEHMYSDLEQT